MKRLIFIAAILLLFSMNHVFAQDKEINRSNNTWFMLMNEVHIGERFFISNEVHIRRADGISNWQQFLLRPAVNYRLNDNVEVSLGYTDSEDTAATVKFELEDEPDTYVLAWTTTPWTLPANLALTVGPVAIA